MSAERHLRAVPDARPVTGTGSGEGAASGAERAPGHAADLADLLERTARGDTDAYEQLYGLVAASVFGLALRIVRDRGMAEDVAQEALVEVWRRATRFDSSAGTARSWILTITHRRAVDRVRSEQAHTDRVAAHGRVDDVGPEDQDAVVDASYREWEAARVHTGLATLTERQREALDLTFFRGFTHREAAHALDIPLGTAKARIRDGLIKLRDSLGVER
ncbi:sigma-70 family RNA polymerase sigma factor [Demequina sp. NBRC 110056]|uniref:sigma-70 family RNA polymerase sigma factor n=1 Tax=Demequina sp. NBRC 110056 TaxID=1570345 RepID=UPI000A05E1E9|nr:sigma-70 family RNA polymerase sigma factor [Demequina sp. NBRC 110056]